MQRKIFTIGYEGRSINEVIELLQGQGIKYLVDVRIRAGSRKKGFSKTALNNLLLEAGVNYQHRRELGTPREMMNQKKKSNFYDLGEYGDYLDARIQFVEEAASDLNGNNFALLCYEHDPNTCHRSVVADRLSKLMQLPVSDL